MDCEIIDLEDWKRQKREEDDRLATEEVKHLQEELRELVDKMDLTVPSFSIPIFGLTEELPPLTTTLPSYSAYGTTVYDDSFQYGTCPHCGHDPNQQLGEED